MVRLVIRPQTAGGGLGFDLRDVLQALGPRVSSSVWAIGDNLNYVSRDESDIPALHRDELRGDELISGLPNLLQVIDGEFKASDAETQPWVVVRAIDSSWWEIISDDVATLDSIRNRFQNVSQEV
jgi:hypothetical protein